MTHLFPPEIIEYTAESHFSMHGKTTQILYITVLLAIVAGIAATPFIKVEVTAQSKGIVKSATENNLLMAAVYGEVEAVYLAENKNVTVGDTLVVISTHKQQEQKNSNQHKLAENKSLSSMIF